VRIDQPRLLAAPREPRDLSAAGVPLKLPLAHVRKHTAVLNRYERRHGLPNYHEGEPAITCRGALDPALHCQPYGYGALAWFARTAKYFATHLDLMPLPCGPMPRGRLPNEPVAWTSYLGSEDLRKVGTLCKEAQRAARSDIHPGDVVLVRCPRRRPLTGGPRRPQLTGCPRRPPTRECHVECSDCRQWIHVPQHAVNSLPAKDDPFFCQDATWADLECGAVGRDPRVGRLCRVVKTRTEALIGCSGHREGVACDHWDPVSYEEAEALPQDEPWLCDECKGQGCDGPLRRREVVEVSVRRDEVRLQDDDFWYPHGCLARFDPASFQDHSYARSSAEVTTTMRPRRASRDGQVPAAGPILRRRATRWP